MDSVGAARSSEQMRIYTFYTIFNKSLHLMALEMSLIKQKVITFFLHPKYINTQMRVHSLIIVPKNGF